MGVTWVVNLNNVPALRGRAPEAVKRGLIAVATQAVTTAKGRARVDTGRMRDSTIVRDAGDAVESYAGAPYSGFLDQGTRYIAGDRWFSASCEEAATNAESLIAAELGAGLGR